MKGNKETELISQHNSGSFDDSNKSESSLIHQRIDSEKNYITLLAQKERANLQNGVSALVQKNIDIDKSKAIETTKANLVSEFIPSFKLQSQNLIKHDYLSFGRTSEVSPHRLDQFVQFHNGGNHKLLYPSANISKSSTSVIIRDLRTFIENSRCPVCLLQDCTCAQHDYTTVNNIKKHKSPINNNEHHLSVDNPISSIQSFLNANSDDNKKYTMSGSPNTLHALPKSKRKRTKYSDNTNPSLVCGQSGQKTKSTERTCGVCGIVFGTHRDVLIHNKTHAEKPKTFGCQLCGKYFSQRTTLKQHLILHSGEKNFACDNCGKRFALKIYLKTHKKSCASTSS